MAVTATPYWAVVDHLAQKRIDVDTDTLKVALLGAGYAPNLDTHDYFNDVTNEVSGEGYTAGGAALASPTWTYNSVTKRWTLDAADTAWEDATIAGARYAVIYDDTPATAATKPLIALIDFGELISSTAAPFTITWSASGIVSIGKPAA